MKISFLSNKIDGYHLKLTVNEAKEALSPGKLVDQALSTLGCDSSAVKVVENPRFQSFNQFYDNLSHKTWVLNTLKRQGYIVFPPKTKPEEELDFIVLNSAKVRKKFTKKFYRKDGTPKSRPVDILRAKARTLRLHVSGSDSYAKDAKSFMYEQTLNLFDRNRFAKFLEKLYIQKISL